MMVHSGQEASIPVADMSALIALLEASETGSYVLDEIISDALCKSKFRTCIVGLPDEQGGLWMYEFDGHAPSSALQVTQSLDAALALAERVLPGWSWCVARDAGASEAARFRAWVQSEEDRQANPLGLSSDAAASAALALCISILRAIHHGYEAAGEVSPNLKAKAQGEGG